MSNEQDFSRPLGSWTPEELRPTLKEFSGAGSDSDAEPVIRFRRGVARVVRRREAVDESASDPKTLSVFLLEPEGAGQSGLRREPMLDSGVTPLAGKIWFVNAAVACGKVKELAVFDADGVFRVITEELGLGSVPTVVVDPRLKQTEARYYPNGLNDPNDYQLIRLQCADVDLHQICDVIENVYRQCLITPDAQPAGLQLWQTPRKYWPQQDAEHRIQAILKGAFAGAFPTCKVFDEVSGTMGRVDLHLEEPDPVDHVTVTHLAVLELKVLRSFTVSGESYSDNDNAERVAEGVKQAGAYRLERGYKVAALCCFDMRREDTGEGCFEHFRELASRMVVALRRWYIYASSELCREVLAARGSAS